MMSLAEMVRRDREELVHRLLSNRRWHRRRFSDLRRADDAPGSGEGRDAVVGLFLPDKRFDNQLWIVLRRNSEREDHLGEAEYPYSEVRD